MQAYAFQEVLNLYWLSVLEKIQHLHNLVHFFHAGRDPHLHYFSLLGVDRVLAAGGDNANFIHFLFFRPEEEVGDYGGHT